MADVAGVAAHERENLRGQLLAGSVEIDVALDDLNDRRARRADRVIACIGLVVLRLDRIVELDFVDVPGAAERRECCVDASEP